MTIPAIAPPDMPPDDDDDAEDEAAEDEAEADEKVKDETELLPLTLEAVLAAFKIGADAGVNALRSLLAQAT